MATLTIIRGAHGSANKQVGDILEKCTGAHHINIKGKTDREMRSSLNLARFHLEAGSDAIVSGSLLTRASVMMFVNLAANHGAQVGIIKTGIVEKLDKNGREKRKKDTEEFEAVML